MAESTDQIFRSVGGAQDGVDQFGGVGVRQARRPPANQPAQPARRARARTGTNADQSGRKARGTPW